MHRTTSATRLELKRFLYQGLCLLMLLQGPPLLALESAAPPKDDQALTALTKSVERLAAEPWLDAMTVLLALGSNGDPRHEAVPPLPPGFEPGRPTVAQRATNTKDATAVNLGPGWNLVSLPAEPSDPDPAVVFAPVAGVERVYAYDACDPADPWKLYDPEDPAASDLVAIDHRMGLWVESRGHASLPIEGTPPASTDLSLCSGWNLIGYPSAAPRPVPSALAPLLGTLVRVFGYDTFDALVPWEVFDVVAPRWANDLGAMAPGRGYWVLVGDSADFELVNEGAPPEIALDTPGDLDTVTSFTDVVGTVRSPLLQGWTLSVRPLGESGGTVVATGDFPIESQALGVLDPTLLENGLFELELRAVDILGQTTTLTRQVVIDGGLKLGVFRFSLLDMELDVLGVPLQVIRTYDSRDKEVGDFGTGWRLSTTDVTLRENVEAGRHWFGTKTNGVIPTFCVEPARLHLVTITFGSGQVFRFQPRPVEPCQLVAPPQVVELEYIPLPGTLGSLVPLDRDPEVLVAGAFPGAVDLLDFTASPFDPQRYQLTTRDGLVLVIDDVGGLESITDRNGNRVTFSATGISHTAGLDIDIERDSAGRITRVGDPLGGQVLYAYDANGDLVSVVDPVGEETRYTYLENHYLHEILAADGEVIVASEYDGDGRRIRSCALERCLSRRHVLDADQEIWTDPAGRETVLTYDARGEVVATTQIGTGGETLTSSFEYNDLGLPTRIVDPGGGITTFTYDSRGNRTSVTRPHATGADPADYTTLSTYDSRNLLTSVTRPSGASFNLSYDSRGNRTQITDGEGRVLESTVYRADGAELQEQDPFGTYTYSGLDSAGRPTTIVDPSGSVLTSGYDVLGRVTSLQVDDEPPSTFAYDALGRQTSALIDSELPVEYGYQGSSSQWNRLESPMVGSIERQVDRQDRPQALAVDGRDRFSYGFDDHGRLASVVEADGRTTGFTYDGLGRIATEIAPNGGVTRFFRDALGRVVEEIDALGHRRTISYGADGSVVSTTDALGNTWTYGTDPLHYAVTDPLGRTTTTHLDPLGLPTRTVYPDGGEQTMSYLREVPIGEESDHPTELVDEAGRRRTYGYDVQGVPVTATDLAGQVYRIVPLENGSRFEMPNGETFEHHQEPDLTFETFAFADGGLTRYDYGPGLRLDRQTWPSGASVTYGYDAFHRLTRRTDSATGEVHTYEWNDGDELVRSTSALGETLYSYDDLGLLIEQRSVHGARIRYTRDLLGRVVRVDTQAATDAQALSTHYAYDANGNLTSIVDPVGGTTTFLHDVAGRPLSRTLPNGVITTYEYDLRDRLTQLTHRDAQGTILASFGYQRGPAGEPTRIVREDGSSTRYETDGARRLTREASFDAQDSQIAEVSYTYDAAGNRLSRSDATGTTTSTYDAGFRLATVRGPAGTEVYAFDPDGRQETIHGDGPSLDLGYTTDGRLSSVLDPTGSQGSEYRYDSNGRRVEARDDGGTVRQLLVAPLFGAGLETPHLIADGDGNALVHYAFAGEAPLVRIDADGEPTYYLSDGLGSVVALADDAGNITARFDYDAFGRLRNAEGAEAPPPPGVGGDFRFHGGWFEQGSGLYHFRERDYDPRIGRFLTRDPVLPQLSRPESSHPYAFADGNPVLHRDPDGRFSLMTVGFNLNMQSIMSSTRAFLANRVREEVREQVLEFATNLVVDSLVAFIPIDIGKMAGFAVNVLRQGHALVQDPFETLLELGVGAVACNLFDNHEGISFEPPVDHSSGRIERIAIPSQGETAFEGYPCPSLLRPQLSNRNYVYPDFYFTVSGRPSDNSRGLVLGEVKKGIKNLYDKWVKAEANQFKGYTRHARFYMPTRLLFGVAFEDGKEALKIKLASNILRRGAVAIIVALGGKAR